MITLAAGLAMLAATANAQVYRCENGELVGGQQDVTARCTVNSAGQITSVTPYTPGTRETLKIYRGGTINQAPAQTYSSTGSRTYQPAPLKPQAHQPATTTMTTKTRYTSGPSAYPVRTVSNVSPNGNIYSVSSTRRLAATGAPRLQRAASAKPCDFSIREVTTRGGVNIYEVCYSDTETRDRKSLQKLYSRVKKASRRACGTDHDSILTRWSRANAECTDARLDRAVMASGIDPLRAYHLTKTGRGVPTVYVGEPRDG